MGKIKNLLLELQEQSGKRILAQELGISYEELTALEYKIEEEIGNDGQLYHYIIKFSPENSQEILNKINGLENGNAVYLAPWQLDREYDYEAHFSAISEKKNQYKKFIEDIENIKKLNQLKLEDSALEQILKRQIFISVIGLMETFLSDTFINLTNNNSEYFKNFIETHPEFRKRKFELRDIFFETGNLKENANKVMMDTIYHNLFAIKEMFKDTFKIEFPQITEVYPYVIERHDLVHRNGKTKTGSLVEIDSIKINKLIEVVSTFIKETATKLNIK